MTGRRFYEFGPSRLDVDGRLLFRGSTPVQVPPKAIDTLIVLVEDAGAVIDKEEISSTSGKTRSSKKAA
jgi:DNA-binding winged helix-turn-helix (wHTH) protein